MKLRNLWLFIKHLPHASQSVLIGLGIALLGLFVCSWLWSLARRQRRARLLRLDRRDLGWLALTSIFLLGAMAGTNILANNGTFTGLLTAATVNNVFYFCEQPGAHCDGATDDSPTFSAGMTRAGTLGGLQIIFGAGKTAFFSSTITINSPNVSLDCETGWSSGEQPNATHPACELLFAAGNNVTGIDMTSTPNANIATSVQIRHLYIVGQASGTGTGNGIHITTNGAVAEYNRITGFGNCGVSVDSSGTGANPNFARLIQNYSFANKGDGYCLNGSGGGNDNVGVYEQNTADSNGGWGFNLLHGTIQDPSTNQLRANHCISNTSGCIKVNGNGNILIGNYTEQAASGITLDTNSSNTLLINAGFGGPTVTDNGLNNFSWLINCGSTISGLANQPCMGPQINVANVGDPGHVYAIREGFISSGRFDITDLKTSVTWLQFVPSAPNLATFGIGNFWYTEGGCTAGNAGTDNLCADSSTHRLLLNNNNSTTWPISQTIATGTAAMTTAGITAGNCGTTVTVAATGVATTDTITWSFNAAPAGSNAGLVSWPTSGNVNFAYCPNTAETPAAATINWKVMR